MKTALSLIILVIISFGVEALNQDEKTMVDTKLRELIASSGNGDAMEFIPGFVRLSFHDCVGGCNGCVNLANRDNAGLEEYIGPLDTVYNDNNLASVLSRADYFAMAGIMALTMAVERPPGRPPPLNFRMVMPTINFKWGRQDCATSPTTAESIRFPHGHFDLQKTLNFFANEFNFTTREVVALIGAHTLGRASRNNSGWAGNWVTGRYRLSNEFYRDMADASKNWTQIMNRPRPPPNMLPRYQWVPNDAPHLMLNSDMCLYKDFNTSKMNDNTMGAASCLYAECSPSPTASIVDEYIADNALWLLEFSRVFEKMINHGSESILQDVVNADTGVRADTSTGVSADTTDGITDVSGNGTTVYLGGGALKQGSSGLFILLVFLSGILLNGTF